jgi:hypothetical protein
MRITLATVVLFACSIPDKHPGTISDGPGPSDAPSGHDGAGPAPDASSPFGCFGHPLPTTAPPTVTVSGTVTLITTSGTTPMTGATLQLYPAEGSAVATAISDAAGHYMMSVATGGTPYGGYVLGNGSGDLQAYVFPSRPFDSDTYLAVNMITQQTLSLAGQVANVPIQNGMAQFAIVIVDCDGTPLSGAKLTAASGTVRYGSGGLPTEGTTSTDATGEVFVFNVAPGGFTVSGTAANGDSLRSHVVGGVGDALTQALLQP